jgi:holin-like protein
MIVSLSLILLCQLIGEIIAHAASRQIPGPVIGMALLFVLLLLRDRTRLLPREARDGSLTTTCRSLLQHLSLLFVPAGVGVVQRLDLLASYGAGLGVAIVVSTVLTLLATVAAFRIASRLLSSDPGEGEPAA